MDLTPDFDYKQERLNFLKKIIPRDDLYEFVDIALQMTSAFCLYASLEDIMEFPECKKAYYNVMSIRDKYIEQDLSPIEVSKFELME